MGGCGRWNQGRHAVAIAAVLFYAFLATWLPLSASAIPVEQTQQIFVIGALDGPDEDLLENTLDVVLATVAAEPSPVFRGSHEASRDHSRRDDALRLSRARDPPSLKA
ncbi:MAG: hypothetical protein K2Y29_00570 [Beijerinckiaceae bacterium]|nr:hypothetical protein [Beijerinckiaceae bacterium]